jgi:Cu+-exporting ATPase
MLDHQAHSHSEPARVTDPVCGMRVDAASTPHRHADGERVDYFCSAGCRSKFIANP